MQAQPPSFLPWFLSALGVKYAFLLPLAAIVALVIVVIVLARGRGAWAAAAAVLAPWMPLLVGLLGTVEGLITSYLVIASAEATPRPGDVAQGISTSLVAALVGLTLTAPVYLVAILGLLARSLMEPKGK